MTVSNKYIIQYDGARERVYSIQYDGFKYTLSHPIWRFQIEYFVQYDGFQRVYHPIWQFHREYIPSNMTVSNTLYPIQYDGSKYTTSHPICRFQLQYIPSHRVHPIKYAVRFYGHIFSFLWIKWNILPKWQKLVCPYNAIADVETLGSMSARYRSDAFIKLTSIQPALLSRICRHGWGW